NVKAVAASFFFSYILKTDGSLWVVGENGNGQLGVGTSGDYRYSPVRLMENVTAISTGESHGLILKADHTVWETGFINCYTALKTTPEKIAEDAKSIETGMNFNLIIKSDNSLWGRGNNAFGNLGDGSGQNRPDFVQIYR
ncbi:MAG TPA: hypothetical protein PKL81_01595, partial [Ferruginibacter sp.]|nr:hypothetical protein [Ferruginibacter sp.]